MPPPATPAPAASTREETLPYEVEKPSTPSSRPPPPPSAEAKSDATLVGVSPQKDDPPNVIVEPDEGSVDVAPTRRSLATQEAKQTVSAVASRLGEGFRRAGQSLAESTAGDFETLLPAEATDEPTDPLDAMAARLVRESDFWRRLALRALGRASFADRLGYTAGVVAVVTSIGLAIVAGLGALFAGGNVVAARALIVVAGVLSIAAGSAVAIVLTHTVRRTQRDLAAQALARAELAETRHHRLSALLALRAVDAKAFREALVSFLGEATAGGPLPGAGPGAG